MGWKIDHLYDAGKPMEGEKSRFGTHTKDYGGGKLTFRVLDDDGHAVYRALCDTEDDGDAFHEWAEADVGATILEQREHGAWVRVH